MPWVPRHKRQSLAPAAARAPASARTARAPLATPSASLTIQKANPKRPGTASHERYERYKGAKTLDELLELGGSRADFNHDKAKGFIVVDGEVAARSAHDPAERRAASGTKRLRGAHGPQHIPGWQDSRPGASAHSIERARRSRTSSLQHAQHVAHAHAPALESGHSQQPSQEQ